MNGDSEELEIEIDANGQVKVHVRGRSGAACLDFVEIFKEALEADVKSVQKTSEFYEEDSQGAVRQSLGQRIAARLRHNG